MPVAYLLLTPLGLFTLDSSSWQTRGHQGAPAVTPPSITVATTGGAPSP
jgi:N-acetylglucosaminyltransferase